MKRKWWQEEVVYQIYPKSFCDSNNDGIGDINGIISKLDYLKNLGITMIWICPIYKSPMDDNGYDVADYKSLAEEFGTMEDLDELIVQAKNRNIKIILDLVINHTSDEHEWFQKALAEPNSEYHDYYIFKTGTNKLNNWRSVFGGSVWEKVQNKDEYYFHAFGKKQPDLNWENEILRKKLYEMVNWWMDKGIAGFRIDAITFIKKDLTWKDKEPDGADGLSKCTKSSRNQQGIEKYLIELKNQTFDKYQCMTVAEAPGVDYEELDKFIGENGYFSMIFDFRYADLDVASGSEWFKRILWTVEELNHKIMESQMALQKFGWSANFIENHDQPRASTKYLKEAQYEPDAVKMLGAMYFFLRGTPFIYQAQELGMVNFERKSIKEFNDLSSIDQYYRSMNEGLTEEEAMYIINMRSRDNSRTPFPWTHEQYGGFSKVKPWLEMTQEYPQINSQAQIGKEESIFEFYKNMIQFRQHGPFRECLIYGNIKPIKSSKNVIAYRRYIEKEYIDCWFNFSNIETEETILQKNMKMIWGNQTNIKLEGNILRLQPYQAVLLKAEK